MSLPDVTDSILLQHSAIVGKTGSGKTYKAKGDVEYLLERKIRTCIVDPTGAWWGLRSNKSGGKKGGFPVVVFGGDHADVPIDRSSGAKLAAIIASGNFPAIVDLSGFNRTEGRTFMTAFLNTLYDKNRARLNLVIDEADLYAPQRPLADSRLMLNAMENIVSRGRLRGLRITMITQRPAKLHKDCLTQVNSITMMRVLSPQDRNALKAWVHEQGEDGRGSEILAALPKLEVGSGYLWAPEEDFLELVKFPTIKTFDSSCAPDSDERSSPVKFADVDLSVISEMLEPKEPKKPAGKKKAAPTVDIEAIRDKAFNQGHETGYRVGFYDGAESAQTELAARMEKTVSRHPTKTRPSPNPPPSPVSKGNGRDPVPATKDLPPLDAGGDKSVGSGETRMLAVLYRFSPGGLSNRQWAVQSGMKYSGGSWGTYKSRLRTRELITEENGKFYISDDGLANFSEPPENVTPDDIISMWCHKKVIGGGAARMLRILVELYDAPVERSNLADHADMTASGGSFGTYISRLHSAALIEKTPEGIKASPNLFITPE